MDISINISSVSEGKKYVLEFCISQDGEVIKTTKSKKPSPKKPKSNGLSLEDFEEKENPPQIDNPKITSSTKEFKVESSFDGKIDPTK